MEDTGFVIPDFEDMKAQENAMSRRSIAISLKRIADCLERNFDMQKEGYNLHDAIVDMAQRRN